MPEASVKSFAGNAVRSSSRVVRAAFVFAVVAFTIPGIALAAPGDVLLRFRDAAFTVPNGTYGNPAYQAVVSGNRYIGTAKAILQNTSTGARVVTCRLDLTGVSTDYSQVTLQAGELGNVSLVVAGQATGGWVDLYCTANGTGVTVNWSKVVANQVSTVSTSSM